MTPHASGRRWTFGLRAMLLAFAVVACWTAWEMNVVRRRAVAVAALRNHPGYHVITVDLWEMISSQAPPDVPPRSWYQTTVREGLFGDVPVRKIHYFAPSETGYAEFTELQAMFPEAEFQEIDPR
ncbi:MAG: hypothetical protein QM811_00930 [Pirellulales bacterium]